MADEKSVKREVLKKLTVSPTVVKGDRTLKGLVDDWSSKSGEFTDARQTLETSKQKMMKDLQSKLAAKGISDGVNWDVRKDPENLGGLIVEILKGQKGKRRSKIDTEEVTF